MLPPGIRIRMATPKDCAAILRHRRAMFEDMNEGTPEELDKMVRETSIWLFLALSDGTYRGWLAEDGQGSVVAGGGLLILSWPASPKDPYPRRALILNVYTEPEFRGQGLARQIMLLIIDWLKGQGFRSVALHASEAGRHLYETLGFKPTNEMRLRFD
jgi:GNAT superfamily N-acetyltransferase